MEKIHGNMHVFVLSCKFLTSKHKNIRVSMYFLHLVFTFTPHYIITDKGLLLLVQEFPTHTCAHVGTYMTLYIIGFVEKTILCAGV